MLCCCPGDNPTGTEYISTGQFMTLKLNVAYDPTTEINANFSGFFVSYTDNWGKSKSYIYFILNQIVELYARLYSHMKFYFLI